MTGWFARERVLGVLRSRASTYPDDSRGLSAAEIAEALGGNPNLDVGRVAATLRQAARRGLCWRTPGPGSGHWINGPVPANARMEPTDA